MHKEQDLRLTIEGSRGRDSRPERFLCRYPTLSLGPPIVTALRGIVRRGQSPKQCISWTAASHRTAIRGCQSTARFKEIVYSTDTSSSKLRKYNDSDGEHPKKKLTKTNRLLTLLDTICKTQQIPNNVNVILHHANYIRRFTIRSQQYSIQCSRCSMHYHKKSTILD